jgi:L-methionine (R)-S-oxide reductase
MDKIKKASRYQRLYDQIEGLLQKTPDPVARMATVCAVMKNKMEHFFWFGFYRVEGENLVVGPYQGPLACQVLQGGGVCLASVQKNVTVIVPNVHEFPGHIACDSRTNSEIAVPVHDKSNKILAVLDIDSLSVNSFDDVDARWLETISKLIYR